jgi:hypothetical protein
MADQTIEPSGTGEFDIYEHGRYGRGSVLSGQARRSFLDSFNTLEEAKKAYPKATVNEHSTRPIGAHSMPTNPPHWFDPADAGENWGEDY